MSLPLAIHHRLDVVVEQAQDVNPSRADIIGMLLSEADPYDPGLEARILAYKKLQVGEVLPHSPDEPDENPAKNVYPFPKRQPGRPKRKNDRA